MAFKMDGDTITYPLRCKVSDPWPDKIYPRKAVIFDWVLELGVVDNIVCLFVGWVFPVISPENFIYNFLGGTGL